MASDSTVVTELLARARAGDRDAEERLFQILYRDLRRLAASFLRRERPNHTLQPTALVHEAYLKLFGEAPEPLRDRRHFLALAATVMRRLLVDHARARRSQKRGQGAVPITLDRAVVYDPRSPDQMIFIDQILTRLAEFDARQSRVLEMRFFAGLTEREIADVLGVSERTVKRDSKFGQAWLAGELRKAGVAIA